jgi:hypothetical protein
MHELMFLVWSIEAKKTPQKCLLNLNIHLLKFLIQPPYNEKDNKVEEEDDLRNIKSHNLV